MKTTITFNLPEDKEEYQQALNVGRYFTAISDYAQQLQQTMVSDKPEADYAKWAYEQLIAELNENGMLELFDVR
ncbi:MAG: hypothetical protein EOO90_05195 [Pedobacter sp.]|nr:MAG: hypothetical protein EOO90_05195 [Pedobacter sp.]